MKNTENIFFVGPVRTGTTKLYFSFLKNTNSSLIDGKETYYFDDNYKEPISNYLKKFTDRGGKCIDLSPTYFSNRVAAARIKKHFPDAKIVITLRRSSDLLMSQYKYEEKNGRSAGVELKDYIHLQDKKYYVDRLKYMESIPFWINIFGSENVFFVGYNDLMSSYESVFKDICAKLNIDVVNNNLESSVINSSKGSPRWSRAYVFINSIGRKLQTIVPRSFLLLIKSQVVDRFLIDEDKKIEFDEKNISEALATYKADNEKLREFMLTNSDAINIINDIEYEITAHKG